MSTIKLLDCTLRDGGYINNWNFGSGVIRKICESVVAAKIDIIEVGFLTDLKHGNDESLYSNCAEIREKCGSSKGSSMYAAMIALGEKELDPVGLENAQDSVLDIVRITFHRTNDEIERAIRYARCLMEKGYKVCMQPVGTTSYTDKQLLELIEKINELHPYAFYLVDTLGILYKNDLRRFLYLIDYNLAEGIRLGFHSHNNLQLSFANAQYIADYHSSREFIVDSSVYGMGRGAGNLCTELIAQYTNDIGMSNYNIIQIYEILDNYIYPLFLSTPWGYSAHYYISAVHKCHPNYASFLMNKQTLTMNEIDFILKNLPADKHDVFDSALISKLYYDYQHHDTDDSSAIEKLRAELSGKDVLLVAPGKSIISHKEKLEDFIAEKSPIVISINGTYDGYDSSYVFISNLKRLYALEQDKITAKLILTSNLPSIIKDCLCVDYSSLCNSGYEESDNSGIMAMRLVSRLGVKCIYTAGFDGFDETVKNNYYDEKMVNSAAPESVERKNISIRNQISELMKNADIRFLTPSRYVDTPSEKI